MPISIKATVFKELTQSKAADFTALSSRHQLSNRVSLIPALEPIISRQGNLKPIGRPGLMAGLDGNVSDGVTLTKP